jgi:hypothetical protein
MRGTAESTEPTPNWHRGETGYLGPAVRSALSSEHDMHDFPSERILLILCLALCSAVAGCKAGGNSLLGSMAPGVNGPAWYGYARDAHHSAQSPVGPQPLARIHWSTPVDLNPQYYKGELLIHYGSPVITPSNTVIVPVKTGATDGFRIEAHNGTNGSLLWQVSSDYTLPQHHWTPSFNPSMTLHNRVYFPGSGGKLFYRDNPDSAQGTIQTSVFYGLTNYNAAKSAYDAAVRIETPITIDGQGNAYLGFTVNGATPLNLVSGIARIAADVTGTWVAASVAAGDASITQVAMNCAPALSPDMQSVYVAVSDGSTGYLLGLDSTTLTTKYKARLFDPSSGQLAFVSNDSTASPTVGPDGDVYYGVLEPNLGTHNDRGWLLHFDSTLSQSKVPGSFGWDDTASIVPAVAVPSYTGSSSYLLATKYNNYAGVGTGDGLNKIAVLDPNATEPDPIAGNPVMKEILTILGQTPNPGLGGVREWCINTAAVDPAAKSVYANSEDGYLYRWDLATNTFPERVQLTSGIGEAYTSTVLGPDGQIYAVNNAVLFAIGQ